MIFKLLCRCQHSSHTSTDYFSTVYNKTEKSLVRCLRVVYFTVLIEVTLGNVLNSLFMPNTQNRRYFSRVYVTLSLNTSLPSFCRPPRIVVCAFRGRSASTRASVPRCVLVCIRMYVREKKRAPHIHTNTTLRSEIRSLDGLNMNERNNSQHIYAAILRIEKFYLITRAYS